MEFSALRGILVASAVALAVALVVPVPVALAGVVTLAFAFAVAALGAGVVAVSVLGVIAGAVALVAIGVLLTVVVGAVAIAVVFGVLKARWWSALLVAVLCLAAIPLAVGYLPALMSVAEAPEWTLLVFLGALPLVNALFDWMSIAVTRTLLRTGQRKGGWSGLWFALVDLTVATLLLFALMMATTGYVELLNVLSVNGGGEPVLDITDLLRRLRETPFDVSLWWIYVTIFTTFVPSLVNLALVALSLMRGPLFLSPWIGRALLPEDPERLTGAKRFQASVWLTSQVVFSSVGALFAGLLFLSLGLFALNLAGAGLLPTAERAYELMHSLGAALAQ